MAQMVSISCYQRLLLKRLEPTVVHIRSESTSERGIAPRHRISSKMAFPLSKECILRVASDKETRHNGTTGYYCGMHPRFQ